MRPRDHAPPPRRDAQFKRGALSAALREALGALPGWEWTRPRDRIDPTVRLGQVRDFIDRHGRYPRHSCGGEERRLANWITNQVTAHRNNNLVPAVASALESLPAWRWEVRRSWDEVYEELRDFVHREGRYPATDAPRAGPEQRLAAWVAAQRHRFASARHAPRAELLSALPAFPWEAPGTRAPARFAANVARIKRLGPVGVFDPVERRWIEEYDAPLRRWAARQVRERRDGLLPEERVKALSAIEWWSWEEPSGGIVVRGARRFVENAHHLAQHLSRAQQRPRLASRSASCDDDEARVGRWLRGLRAKVAKRKSLPSGERAVLVQIVGKTALQWHLPDIGPF